ncbi:MAG: hypothetical protein NZ926_02565 [Candidatus Methanomethylicia archaeon]|nr:hypothetical protein [Candidatus Methanomethylicia archaeon]MCX8169203.1 hypothetical protein [Candidatus Methanomethylicia archaeon]MDW7989015.1 hypothetical protein [Nitrososphaerota archaeon]
MNFKWLLLISIIVLVFINPILPLILISPLLMLYAIRIIHNKNTSSSHKVIKEILFRNMKFNNGEEVKVLIKFKVFDRFLKVYGTFGHMNIYSGISFSGVKDFGLLRSILLTIPFNYYLIFIGGNTSKETFILLLNVKVSWYEEESVISKIVEVINSLSLSIPANEIKILNGYELTSKILPFMEV